MNLLEIKEAITKGKTVHWKSSAYKVIRDNKGQYMIKCYNGSCIGLTWMDGVTLNGKEEDFYAA